MSSIKCSTEGCENTFSTDEPLADGAKFTCKEHTGLVMPDWNNGFWANIEYTEDEETDDEFELFAQQFLDSPEEVLDEV